MTLAHIQKTDMIFFQTILFHNLSLTISNCFFFAKKLSKLCFYASGNSAENKSVLSFHPFFLLPKVFKVLTAWELCLNTLEGTSFVVQVESTSTWVVVTENKRGYISCGSVQVEGTSTRFFKENKGGYIACGSFACKGFYKVERNHKNRWLLGD